MLRREAERTVRCTAAAASIGDDRRSREALLRQELAHQPNFGLGVPAGLNQKIQDLAVAPHGTPEAKPLARDHDNHLIQVPPVGRGRSRRICLA